MLILIHHEIVMFGCFANLPDSLSQIIQKYLPEWAFFFMTDKFCVILSLSFFPFLFSNHLSYFSPPS